MSPSETSYEVIWQRDTSVGCPHADDEGSDIISTSNSYHIVGLEEDSGYIITVRAFNAEGIRNTVTVMTLEAGERGRYSDCIHNYICTCIYLQLHLLHLLL